MIVYPLTMPATPPGPKSIQLAQNFIVAGADSPFTAQQQIYEHQGSWWTAHVDLPFLTRANAAPWLAFLAGLNGKSGTFLLGDPLAAGPIGSAGGSPIVSGAGQSGKRLAISGLTGVLKAGDLFQIGSAGENLLLWSQDLEQSSWAKNVGGGSGGSAPVVTADFTTAPDGTSTADKVVFGGVGTQDSILSQGLTPPSVALTAFTFSVWMMVASGTASVNLDVEDSPFTQGIGSTTVTVTTSWQRFSVTGTFTAGASSSIVADIFSFANATVFVWGAQLERGGTMHNYIPTLGSSIGPTQRLYMNLMDTSGGSPVLDVFPRLRTVSSNANAAPLAGEALILANPRGLFRLASNAQPYTIDQDGHYSISFDAREAF